MSSSEEPISLTSLTIDPLILGPGQSEIRIDATVNRPSQENIIDLWVDMYRPDRSVTMGSFISIYLSPIVGSDRWTGTYVVPTDYPDTVLSNYNACGFITITGSENVGPQSRVIFNAPTLNGKITTWSPRRAHKRRYCYKQKMSHSSYF